jgi:hypothetical protein
MITFSAALCSSAKNYRRSRICQLAAKGKARLVGITGPVTIQIPAAVASLLNMLFLKVEQRR